jgi:predicted transcriptional regulator
MLIEMKRTPCEYIMWNGVPAIRRQIAYCMINNYGLSQKEAAEKLNLTPAAICMYISKKRGNNSIIDEEIGKEIHKSAGFIIKNGGNNIVQEICRICNIMRAKKKFPIRDKCKLYQ